MSESSFLEHRLRLAVTAARAGDVPIASIAKAAGVTRQTVYNWSTDYSVAGDALTVSAHTRLAELPTQRPHVTKGAPVLVLTRSRLSRRPTWDGHLGKAIRYAGDLLGVSVPGKIVDVIAHSWALVGDSAGEGRRPDPGDLVICIPDGTIGTVADSTGPAGTIDVIEVDGVTRCSRWALVLPGA